MNERSSIDGSVRLIGEDACSDFDECETACHKLCGVSVKPSQLSCNRNLEKAATREALNLPERLLEAGWNGNGSLRMNPFFLSRRELCVVQWGGFRVPERFKNFFAMCVLGKCIEVFGKGFPQRIPGSE